jgi:Fe-S-cluster containining protein
VIPIPIRKGPGEVEAFLLKSLLPFIPLEPVSEQTDAAGVVYQVWKFDCPFLDPGGRCLDYEARPPLCRAYEPRDDHQCAKYFVSSTPPAPPKSFGFRIKLV